MPLTSGRAYLGRMANFPRRSLADLLRQYLPRSITEAKAPAWMSASYQPTPDETKYSLAALTPKWLKTGLSEAGNDVINTIDPNPGYYDYFGIQEPESQWGKVGAELARLGTLWGGAMLGGEALYGGLGALTGLGASIPAGVAVLPAAASATAYTMNPYDDSYRTLGEMYPRKWEDRNPLGFTQRDDGDSELTRRLKQAKSGAIEGSFVDVPWAIGGIKAGIPALGALYFGAPAAANAVERSSLRPSDYAGMSEDELFDRAGRGDDTAYNMLKDMGY